jgi:hypothetical protein
MVSKKSKSILPLLIANVFTLILAVIQKWSFGNLIWVFFFQSVIIGLFNFLNILITPNYKIGDLTYGDGKRIKPTERNRKGIALFFLFHFGLFNFIYFLFLKDGNYIIDWWSLIFLLIVFLINNIITFIIEYNEQKNIGELFAFPYYARVLPMSVVVCLGLFLADNIYSTIFFLTVKILMDVYMQWALYDRSRFDKLKKGIEKYGKIINLFFLAIIIVVILSFFYRLYSSIKMSDKEMTNDRQNYFSNANSKVEIIK